MITTVGDVSPRQAQGHIGTVPLNGNIFRLIPPTSPIRRGQYGDTSKSSDEFKAWFPYDHNSDRFHMPPPTDRGRVADLLQ